MAVNISHVRKATYVLIDTIGKAIEAIENKDEAGDMDDDRVNAYQNFLEIVEEQLDELTGTLEGLA
jgi:hypothetical protein